LILQENRQCWQKPSEGRVHLALTKARHLVGSGLVGLAANLKFTGDFEQFSDDDNWQLWLSQVIGALFTTKCLIDNEDSVLRDQNARLLNAFKVEAALSRLLAKTCGAHYNINGTNYAPYVPIRAYRPFVEMEASVVKVGLPIYLILNYIVRQAMHRECAMAIKSLYNSCYLAHEYSLRSKQRKRKEKEDNAPSEVKCSFSIWQNFVEDGPRQSISGFIWDMAAVKVIKDASCCWEQTRRNATVSQAVVSINQALQRFNDLELLQGGVLNISDLMFLVR